MCKTKPTLWLNSSGSLDRTGAPTESSSGAFQTGWTISNTLLFYPGETVNQTTTGTKRNCLELIVKHQSLQLNDNYCNRNRSYICEVSA